MKKRKIEWNNLSAFQATMMGTGVFLSLLYIFFAESLLYNGYHNKFDIFAMAMLLTSCVCPLMYPWVSRKSSLAIELTITIIGGLGLLLGMVGNGFWDATEALVMWYGTMDTEVLRKVFFVVYCIIFAPHLIAVTVELPLMLKTDIKSTDNPTKKENAPRDVDKTLLTSKVILFLESMMIVVFFWESVTEAFHEDFLGFHYLNSFMPTFICCAYYWAAASWPLLAWLPRKQFLKVEKLVVFIGIIGFFLGMAKFKGGFYNFSGGSPTRLIGEHEEIYCLFFIPHVVALVLTSDKRRPRPSREKAIGAITVNNTNYSYKLWYRDTPFEEGHKGGKIDTIHVSKDNEVVFNYSKRKTKIIEDENLEAALEDIASKYN